MPTQNPVFAWRSRLLRTMGIGALCIGSGIGGGALTRNFGASSYTLSYADFISIMLTAVSLLMTVLAIFLGVFGFIGWNAIEQKVHTKTEDFLEQGFKRGGRLDRIVNRRVKDAVERVSADTMFDGVQEVDADSTVEDDDADGGEQK